MGNTDKHGEMFRDEAYELLSELEAAVLELEERPEDQDLIGRVFRAMHTIKGSGAMFGFDDIASFTHEVETTYDGVRNGKVAVTKELIDLTLQARDCIRAMLDSSSECMPDDSLKRTLMDSFKKLLPQTEVKNERGPSASAAIRQGDNNDDVGPEVTYRIRFKPPEDIFLRGTDPVNLIEEVCRLGEHKIIAQVCDIPYLEQLNADYCYTYWDIILTTSKGLDAIRDVFIFVEEDSDIKIESIHEGEEPEQEGESKKLGEILLERGDVSPDDLTKVLGEKKFIGEMLIEAGLINSCKVEAALAEQRHIREIKEKKKNDESTANVRVASDKLDALVNLVGELVTVQARLSQVAAAENNIKFLAIAEEVERLTAELRDTTMEIRMLPIGTTFSKFRRLVRDLSRELGKEIEMVTEGAETELDKNVIEKLGDPLVHIIRNSIGHGIESPDARRAAGKTPKGTIHLSALHAGANVLIRIKDDGAGLNKDAILTKAVERGLISRDAQPNEKEIFSLIMAPGFSTAEKLTSVSGRGVGMDVVKQAIESLKGSIEISSQKGMGTTITLQLPLTLAIIEGLLVKIADDYFVFPLSCVKECVDLTHDDVAQGHGRDLANVRGEIVPYIKLRQKFLMGDDRPDIEQIVITEIGNRRIGFVVDTVIGEHQTVIKSLGSFYKKVEGISGATILGDGTVALILDAAKLEMTAEAEERALFGRCVN